MAPNLSNLINRSVYNNCTTLDSNSRTKEERIREILKDELRFKNSTLWCSVNMLIFCVLVYDIYWACETSWIYIFECIVAVVFWLNSLYHFIHILRLNYFTTPLEITHQQYNVYGVSLQDRNFKLSLIHQHIKLPSDKSSPNQSLDISNNWLSTPPSSPNTSLSTSLNASMHQRTSPWNTANNFNSCYSNDSGSSFQNKSKSLIFEESEPIDNKEDYKEYLTKVNNSFHYDYNPPDHRPLVSGMPKYVYQTSPLNPYKISKDSDSNSKTFLEFEVWDKLNINRSNLMEWKDNLKMWVHRTILHRLVKEIDTVNELLQQNHNVYEAQIGTVGLEKLKFLTQMAPVSQNIPTLSTLVQYLKISPNQQYVVQRIKELSKSWQMLDYKWNGGGCMGTKQWNAHLPTDAQLIMHLVLTYFDIMIPPPLFGDTSFSSKHFTCTPSLPAKTSNTFVIHQFCVMPPHYQLVIGDQTYDVPKGRNNMFETILAFIHFIKTEKHGIFDRLDIGPTGINILWVVEDTKTSPQKLTLPANWNL